MLAKRHDIKKPSSKKHFFLVPKMETKQKSREEVLEEARQKLKLFQEANKTSFKEDGTYRGILSVTSGLELPKRPLKSIPTADIIYKR